MENQRNERLWKEAEARTAFRSHFTSYVLVNLFLIGVWYFSGGSENRYFWPVWPILGWGFGVAMHYFRVYHNMDFFSPDREYEKLVKEENKNRN